MTETYCFQVPERAFQPWHFTDWYGVNPFTAMMSFQPIKHLKPLSLCVFFFTQACERIFIKMHSIESRCVKGPENILSAGTSLHLSAQKIWQAEAVKGLKLLPQTQLAWLSPLHTPTSVFKPVKNSYQTTMHFHILNSWPQSITTGA